jgi:hypothetical protein
MRTLISKPFCLGLVALSLALAPMVARAAENPVAEPKVSTVVELPLKQPGQQNYVLQLGKVKKIVKATTIKVVRPGDPTKATAVFVDGVKQLVAGTVAVAVATGTSSGGAEAQYSQTTTTTQLPGGGTRTDIDHGNGSSTTIIHDPHGGKNGGTRTTTSTTDSEGNTTTTTTTTDGSDGSSTTTTTTSP